MLNQDKCPGCGKPRTVYFNIKGPRFGMFCPECIIVYSRDAQIERWQALEIQPIVSRRAEQILNQQGMTL